MSAIMDDPKDGIDVHIKVDGQHLKEYVDDDDEDPPRTITKYVIARSGAHFAVAYKFKPNFVHKNHELSMEIHLDGHLAFNRIVYPRNIRLQSSGTHVEIAASRSHQDGRFWERKFTFAELVVDESGVKFDATKKKAIDALGEIAIKWWRIKVTSKSKPPMENEVEKFKELDDGLTRVPEKSIKGRAVSHRAKLGQLQAGVSFSVVSLDFIDPYDAPFAVYSFRYRSEEALKSMYLIPRTPEPVPLEERPVEDLTLEEMRELVRRQKEQLNKAMTVKQESNSGASLQTLDPGFRSQLEDGDDLAVIEERPAKRQRNNSDIETVDLTGD